MTTYTDQDEGPYRHISLSAALTPTPHERRLTEALCLRSPKHELIIRDIEPEAAPLDVWLCRSRDFFSVTIVTSPKRVQSQQSHHASLHHNWETTDLTKGLQPIFL